MNENIGLALRQQALELLRQAQAADGLKASVVTFHNEYGSLGWVVWSGDGVTEEQARLLYEGEFDSLTDRIVVESGIPLESIAGTWETSRMSAWLPDQRPGDVLISPASQLTPTPVGNEAPVLGPSKRASAHAALAAKFSELLGQAMGLDQLAVVAKRNGANHDPGVCASHDFCDANQIMIDSFETVFGRPPELSCEPADGDDKQEAVNADSLLIDHAWNLAKSAGFNVAEVTIIKDRKVVEEAARAALDAGCKILQDYLGETTGDYAGLHFSAHSTDVVEELLAEYLHAQREDHQQEIAIGEA